MEARRAPEGKAAGDAPDDERRGAAAGPLVVVKRDEQDLLDWLGTEIGFLSGVGHYN